METTREQILRLVRGHREVTVQQVAESVRLSHQAVRRHLDGLRADGLLDVRQERHGVGRPAAIYFATERVEELSGRPYVQLLSRLFRHAKKIDGGNEAGDSARQMLERFFAGIAEEVAADHEAEVQGETLDQRVAETSRALASEGIVDGWRKDGGVFTMVNEECPYIRLAALSDAPCRSDRQSIELLVGAHVEMGSRIVDGATVCEYLIRPQPVNVIDSEGETRLA